MINLEQDHKSPQKIILTSKTVKMNYTKVAVKFIIQEAFQAQERLTQNHL